MQCPKCGANNPSKNKFCGECGSSLGKTSADDRIDIVRKDIPVSLVQKILLTKDTIEKERKDVTVIFTDISGFTTMSEALDPEELTLLMNDCFRKLGAMVYRYEGIIDKFIGDCIMAIFGAPVTHEDDPERAILACLDMQVALKEINEHLDPSLKKLEIHSGINTGQVIAGKVGSDLQMDYTVMGNTVNVAQRLKDIATRGSIFVGQETYNRARHAFDFIGLEPVQLKGKAETVQPFEVVGRKWGSEFGSGAIRSDLIGREDELLQLKNGYNQLLEKKSSICVLSGEIGVGKSRLLYEFRKYLTLSGKDVCMIYGRGVSYENSIPFKAFADSLRRFLLADEEQRTDNIDDAIVSRITIYTEKETEDIMPYLGKLFNMELSEEQHEKIRHLDTHSLQLQIFLAVATLLEKIVNKSPLLIIMDDLQWLDSASLDLIHFLLPMVKKSAISFFLCYRIGDLSSITGLINVLRSEYQYITRDISLKNLKDEESATLIDNLIGQDISDSLRASIIGKSGGNPFFIEEIVRHLMESGMLSEKGSVTIESIQVPGSVEAAVSSRIDSLNKESKYLLRIAAIIGRSFPKELLVEVVKDKDILKHLSELEASEFLVALHTDQTTFYTFRHPLFQEVTYNTLLKSERTIYHKVIAETTEEKFSDIIDGANATLAYHYHNSNNPEKALEYAIKAGDDAAQLYANEEALTHYRRALKDAGTFTDKKAAVLEKIADIELLTGRIKPASQHFDEAHDLAQDKLTKARISEKIARILIHTGKTDDGLDLMHMTLEQLKNDKTKEYVILSYTLADKLLEMKADAKKAETLADDAIKITQSLGDRELEADGLRLKAQIMWRTEHPEKALELLEQSVVIYSRVNNRAALPLAYILMAASCRSMGKPRRAIDFLKQAIEIARETDNIRVESICYNNLGIYYDLLGDLNASLEYYTKSLGVREKIGDIKGTGIAYLNIGLLKKKMGDSTCTLEYLIKAKDIFENICDLRSMCTIYISLARTLSYTGKENEALDYLKKALAIAQKKDDRQLLGEAYIELVDYYHSTGNTEQALAACKKAESIFLEEQDKPRATLYYNTVAELFITAKNKKAIEYAEKSLAIARSASIIISEIEALRTLGRAQVTLTEQIDTGVKNIKRSIALAKDIDIPVQIAHSYFALGHAYATQKKTKQAIETFQKARKIYKRVQSQRDIKDVDKILKTLT